MKRQISLKLFITLAFLSLAVVLVIGYSFLSAHYYKLGMITITANDMEMAAQAYIEEVPFAKRDKLNNFRGFKIARSWSQLPDNVQRSFWGPPTEPGFSIGEEGQHWLRSPDLIHFLYMYRNSDETLFVNLQVSKATIPALIDRYIAESRKMLLVISTSIAGLLGGAILLIMRRVSRPVSALREWTSSLDSDNLSQTPPDFSYPELNELAGLVRTSLSSVQESLEREHNFLRHASHELRTPIAIVRNNVELLHKLENQPERTSLHRQAVDRIDRAGHTMQHLTETLLWLSKKEVESLPCKQLELELLLKELVAEMKYLLSRRNVDLQMNTSPCTVILPEFPARIVLGNLIRNAFVYSWEGCITIQQDGNRIVISNPQPPADRDHNRLGFGLGLQLTSQLSDKLGWKYTDDSTGQMHTAAITLSENNQIGMAHV